MQGSLPSRGVLLLRAGDWKDLPEKTEFKQIFEGQGGGFKSGF